MRSDLPTGTITLLFTDIEGSTRLLHELGPEAYATALAEHRSALRAAFAAHNGVEVDTEGDAFFVAFAAASDALDAAADAQAALADGPIQVRMGLHTGQPHVTDEGYVGHDVHLGARIAAAGHGAQVLLSAATASGLNDGPEITDLGEHRLKDFAEPVWIYQLGSKRFPPLNTISNTNLPRPPSSFIGREREVSEVTRLIREDHRLLTLTGPGGSGKTRLAIESAAELISDFPNGVFWIDLAPVRDAQLVGATIAQTIGAGQELSQHIGHRRMLLVVDNLEQVIESGTALSALVTQCPNLSVVSTSRELLRVRGETEFPVLPLPAADAVELFVARSGLPADDAIRELCSALDNLPLAVELAAARASVLSPAQILHRLAQRLDLLKGSRDLEARQQTLRATIEWSYELLSKAERNLFPRLSVFAGGCTLEAAEEVASAHVDNLQSLVDKNLVRHSGERFWMLETIGEFAREQLASLNQTDVMTTRHAEYYVELAERAGVSVEGYETQSGEWERLDVVIAEQANLRRVLERALHANPELGLRMAVALEQFWVTQAPSEGGYWLESLLDRATTAPADLRARAFRCLGGALQNIWQHERSLKAYREGREIYHAAGDESGVATMDFRIGTAYLNLGQPDRARPLLESSLATFRRLGSAVRECEAFGNLASLELEYGDAARGREMLEQNLEMARRVGFKWWEQWKLVTLAEYALKTGDFDEAGIRTTEGLRMSRRLNDRVGKVYGLANLARVAAAYGHAYRAGKLWGAVAREEERSPIGPWEGERDNYSVGLVDVRGAEFERGQADAIPITLDEAVEYALSDG